MEPWHGDKYWVSPLNFVQEVRKDFKFPKEVVFHDVTLRDGEQTPCVVFTFDDKIEIAKALDEIGVQRIEGGMPVVSEDDFRALKMMTKENLRAKVFGFARALKSDVDVVIQTDANGVVCEIPVGVPKLMQFGWKKEEVFDRIALLIDYAKEHGLYTVFFGVDMTRADLSFLLDLLVKLDKETKVDSFAVVDTFGCATPEAFGFLVRTIASRVSKPLEVHTHNDLGLATINTIYGILNGATVAHVSVNGLGERAGNAPLEEVAMALYILYGVPVKLKVERLYELSKLVERLSGFKLARNKPVVGDFVFTRESGIAVAGWMKFYLGSEAFLPEIVGNKHGVVLGKKSGKHNIIWKLEHLNLEASDEEIAQIVNKVKALSLSKKSCISDEEFLRIYNEVRKSKSA